MYTCPLKSSLERRVGDQFMSSFVWCVFFGNILLLKPHKVHEPTTCMSLRYPFALWGECPDSDSVIIGGLLARCAVLALENIKGSVA